MNATPGDAAMIGQLLASQRYAVLSTLDQDGGPYPSLVAFAADPNLNWLVFCTRRATRKHANITANPRVALLVDDRANSATDLQQAAAISILGMCEEAHDGEYIDLRGRFLASHPGLKDFVAAPDCAIMKVAVSSYYLVTSFQHVTQLRP